MTTVEQVRKALEEMGTPDGAINARTLVERALVTEGLKVCEEYDTFGNYFRSPTVIKLEFIASILRSAGRIS